MGGATISGVDLVTNVFQVRGAAADVSVLFRKKLSRSQFARFAVIPPRLRTRSSAHHPAPPPNPLT